MRRKRISLEVLRDGKSLPKSSSGNGLIRIHFDESGEAFIGRLEILPAQHKACGCGNGTNSGSINGKCDKCSVVNHWAVSKLSRRLLRFSSDQDGKVFVQARGKHASVNLGSKLLTSDNDDWCEKVLLQDGDIFRLAPAQIEGTPLELKVVMDDFPEERTVGGKSRPMEASAAHSNEDGCRSEINGIDEESRPSGCLEGETTEALVASAANARDSGTDGPATTQGGRSKRKSKIFEAINQQQYAFLAPLGQDMSSVRRKFLASKAEKCGVKIVDDVFWATHIVISRQVSTLSEVSQSLSSGVSDRSLRSYIEQNDIACVLPSWIANAKGNTINSPGVLDIWHGDLNKKAKGERRHFEGAGRHVPFERNKELAEVFRNLANLHQSCPLLEMDHWKAYMFRIIAGRLTHLDFEIKNDPETLSRLRKISGIGSNSVDKIHEYLEKGTLARIEEFNSDLKRVAMKNMMDIWGVGRTTALNLLQKGFRDIGDVRAAIREGRHFLDRNQLVGVDCYEDILDEMTREEVEKIGEIVDEAVQELYPGAEVRIMGSYRRRKQKCGDIDVHITHENFMKKNPPLGLSKIVDLLWEKGHLIYHLTFLPGMQTGSKVSDYVRSSRHIPREAWKWCKPVGYLTSKGHSGSSYMGVMKSPVVAGRRRRIDIKFYPWRERIFAAIYFTGNGYFNRSMRLWAGRKFGYSLNDHGLYFAGTQDRVMEASTEKQVFEKLDLVYKEPHERDCFDAVVSKEGPVDLNFSEAEFREDNNYVWVN